MDTYTCIDDSNHTYDIKTYKGHVCRLCGVVRLSCSSVAYKSHRYSSKMHFSYDDYEQILREQDGQQRLTHQEYLDNRTKMVRFILDKGRDLKMSLKTLHLAVHLMDLYNEKERPSYTSKLTEMVAACSLLVAAKSGELDERIPFIGKLKKYCGMYQSASEFKDMEVKIANSLDWDLQKITFYHFVEYYLTCGMLTAHDRVSKKIVDSVTSDGVEETVRLLAREEPIRSKVALDNYYKPLSSGSTTSPREDYSKSSGTQLSSLPNKVRKDIVKVFELYCRDLCNLTLREFRYWAFSKNAFATSMILYTRSALLDPSCVWNSRLKELSGFLLMDINEPFGRLSDFIANGEISQPTKSTSLKAANYSSYTSANNLQQQKPAHSNYSHITELPSSLLAKFSTAAYSHHPANSAMNKENGYKTSADTHTSLRRPHGLSELSNIGSTRENFR